MRNLLRVGRNDVGSPRLFEGERSLVITSILGFILAAGIAIFIFFRGYIILPEGNIRDAFSFNTAIGVFILSIAAILPLAKLKARKRAVVRWLFIIASFYAYGVETIQNFRGLNPRFSREGTTIDTAAGMLFGVVSLLLIILALLLTIQFFRIKSPYERPLLIIGIRYAFLSVLAANIAGIWMILLQDRFIGDAGNLIVLHGIGFHALQTLILPGWLLEKAQVNERAKTLLIHSGSIAWILAIILIGFQAALGSSVFELTILSILAGVFLLVWLGSAIVACILFAKKRNSPILQIDDIQY